MMRFPLWLTADVAMAWLAQKPRLTQSARPIQFVDAAEILHPDSSHPVSHERIREIVSSHFPVVWIGGIEPLLHPGISHLVRAITKTGHFVFLETDGTHLRRRIHEFQPVSRLFLTVRLEAGAQSRTSRSRRAGAFELAAEGIRAARLSGFLICVHARVQVETELGEVAKLIRYAHSHDVDGIVITAENGGSNSAITEAEALRRKMAEARKLIGSKWWESFSRLVQPVVSGERWDARSADEDGVRLEEKEHANEESIRIA